MKTEGSIAAITLTISLVLVALIAVLSVGGLFLIAWFLLHGQLWAAVVTAFIYLMLFN